MIAYGNKNKHYKFSALVTRIMREKGWSKEKASAYVAGIEKRQGKGPWAKEK